MRVFRNENVAALLFDEDEDAVEHLFEDGVSAEEKRLETCLR